MFYKCKDSKQSEWFLLQVKIVSQELEVERKRLPPLEDRIVHLESDLASQEDAVRYN